MHYITKFLAFICLLATTTALHAQNTGSISGVVKDARGPIPYASVKLAGTTIGSTTNDSGYFSIKNLQPGTYKLQTSSVGFVGQERPITVKAGSNTTASFTMIQSSQDLKNVEVTGKTQTQVARETGYSVHSIDTKVYANSTADLNQILNRSTGIRVREQGGLGSDFQFSINGLSGKSVRFFLDGIPMEDFGNTMSLNNIPVNLAERVEVYKGVVPVELGSDALGGAINVVTNQNIKRLLDVSYSYGSFNTHRAAVNTRFTDAKTGLFIAANGFYNYSDNNYTMKDISLPDPTNTYFITKDVKRFHNAYHSAMGQVEFGITGKKWADLLSVSALYSSLYNEQQTGATQSVVYGGVNTKEKYLMTSLKYKKENLFTEGLSVNLFAAYARNQSTVTDTSLYQYKWDGTTYPTRRVGTGELGTLSIYKYTNSFEMSRLNVSYHLNDHHSFNLNYTLNNSHREGYNELATTSDYYPGTLTKHVAGLSWQSSLLDDKLVTQVFGKFYGFNVKQTTATYYTDRGLVVEDVNDFQHYFGYGLATRYKITPNWGVKGSFEYAYRLQEITEMFGNGVDIISNLDLKPESSYNGNIGTYYTHESGKHKFTVEASGFYRDAQNFILMIPSGSVSQYLNVAKVRVKGIEGEFNYKYGNLLRATVNANYQNAINNQQYINGNTNAQDLTYKYKIPNQPWFYANGEIGIGKNDLLGKQTRLEFDWYSSYIHWFYLTWSDLGATNSKSIIPTQFVHNATVTYSMKDGVYNVSFEVKNLTDRLAYDNFRLQKPGRSMMIKLRYAIR